MGAEAQMAPGQATAHQKASTSAEAPPTTAEQTSFSPNKFSILEACSPPEPPTVCGSPKFDKPMMLEEMCTCPFVLKLASSVILARQSYACPYISIHMSSDNLLHESLAVL
jgi:hypothetical protein